MLTDQLRPKTWGEMAGQEENIKVLKAILKNPETSPKTLILEGAWGSGKCITKGTRVHTSLGYIKIEDIPHNNTFDSEGFAVCDEEIFVMDNFKASHFYSGGGEQTYIINSPSFDLEGTEEHRIKVLSSKGIVLECLGNLKVGDMVCLDRASNILFNNKTKKPNTLKDKSEKGYGHFLGFFYGDIHFHSVVPHIDWGLSQEILNELKELGIGESFESIPEWFYTSNKDFLRGFIEGFIDTQQKGNILGLLEYTSFQKDLVYSIRDIFNLFGIYPKIEVQKKKDIEYTLLLRYSDFSDFLFYDSYGAFIDSSNEDITSLTNEIFDDKKCYRFEQIRSITLSCSEVFDIHVPHSHLFYANGLINHNTSSVRILAKELNKVTDPNFDLNSSAFYYEFDSTIIGNVEEIKKLRDTLGICYADYWKVVVFDECMSGDTAIVLEDGNTKTIREIVENRERVKVLSYNSSSGLVEARDVIGWFKNNPKIFYTVKTIRQKGFLRCSDNHIFITPYGEKKLNELTINSSIYMQDIKLGSMSIIEDRITSISMDSDIPEDSYDIEVEENHNYFAGGILVHNCHSVSQQAQTALLKVLEEVSAKTFYCLCTTHAHKLIPTIRSRALELRFGKISYEEIIKHLDGLEGRLEIKIPTEIKDLIAVRSEGHVRDIHMLLDRFIMVGEDAFTGSIALNINLLCDFFEAVHNNVPEDVLKCINKLLYTPLSLIESDFSMFMVKCIKCLNNLPVNSVKIERIVKLYGSNITKLIKSFFSDWMRSAFISEYHFEATLLYFYLTLKNDMNILDKTDKPNRVTQIFKDVKN